MKVISFVTAAPVLLATSVSATTVQQHTQNTAWFQDLVSRRLQDDPATNDPCLTKPGELSTVGAFSSAAFSKDQCNCVFQNDLDTANIDQESLGGGEEGSVPDLSKLLDVINGLLRDLNYEYSNDCQNCQCIGTACGTISASERISVQGNKDVNLTLGEVFALLPAFQTASQASNATAESLTEAGTQNVTALATLFGPNLYTENVIDFCQTFGKSSDYKGSACLSVDTRLDGQALTSFSEQPQACTLTYNGKTCTSCQIESRDGTTCATADCSNVNGIKTKMDTCTGTGLDGPLQFLDKSLTAEACSGATAAAMSSVMGGMMVSMVMAVFLW